MKLLLHAIAAGALACLLACAGKSSQDTPRPALPVIVSQPQNAAVTIGAAATFSVDATNGASYQWSSALFDGTGAVTAWIPITGATASSYSFTPTLDDIKTPLPQYRVEVYDATRILSATSAGATLSIVVPAGYPLFTTQPASIVVGPGANAVFTVVNAGTPAPTLQWQKNGVNIAGATSATLTLTGVATADNGAKIRCVATNSVGVNTSKEATLTVGVEQLKNGGFEDGFTQTAWTTSDGKTKPSSWQKMFGDSTATSRLTVRTGAYFLYLGNISVLATDFAYQDVAIDPLATSATLSYAWAIRNNAVAVGDVTFKVEIRDTTNAVLATAKTLDAKTVGSTTSPAPWKPVETFDLLPFKGKTVRITFTSTTSVAGSYAYIGVDDVSVIVAK
jgi:hypothetical protein